MTEETDGLEHALKSLLGGACPERATEIADFWEQFQPELNLKRDDVGLSLSANGNRVSWMHKTLAHDWVVAFAGFTTLHAYTPAVCAGDLSQGVFSAQAFEHDEGLEEAEAQVDEMLYFAKSIQFADDLSELEWSPLVPELCANRNELSNTNDIVCFDIACLSAAASFLHEFRHVKFSAEQNAPIRMEEEKACDDFSRTMLLDKVAEYCATSGENPSKVASKRVFGLATTAFAIAHAEHAGMASAIQNSHPSIRERFIHLVLTADVDANEDCWLYTACLLIALLRRSKKVPQTLIFTSGKDLCQKLADAL